MNTPNKLTVFRAAMVPVFLIVLLWEGLPMRFLWATLIFAGLSLTDMFDGQIARRRGLITNFGKFLDPLADKVLVVSALIGMTVLKNESHLQLICWLIGLIIILAREFMVAGLRLVCVEQGTVIAANFWGKLKTVTQFIAVMVILFTEQLLCWFQALPTQLRLVGDGLFALCVVFTVISGVVYVKQNAGGISQM